MILHALSRIAAARNVTQHNVLRGSPVQMLMAPAVYISDVVAFRTHVTFHITQYELGVHAKGMGITAQLHCINVLRCWRRRGT